MAREYSAGEPGESVDVPAFVQLVRDDLNKVRDAFQKLDEQQYPRTRDYRRPDPVEALRFQAAREALSKEEDRLMAEMRSYEWLLPSFFTPPHNLSQAKAKEILRHGEAHGHPLSERQRGFFGLIAGGGHPTRTRKG